jgi:hypothetical protein
MQICNSLGTGTVQVAYTRDPKRCSLHIKQQSAASFIFVLITSRSQIHSSQIAAAARSLLIYQSSVVIIPCDQSSGGCSDTVCVSRRLLHRLKFIISRDMHR